MKLRNKKTGEVDDFLFEVITNRIDLYRRVGSSDTKNIWKYNTLAELIADWEDVEPAEPLIKDEKIRKAVRAWAEMNDIRFIHMCSRTRKENARIVGQNALGRTFTMEIDNEYEIRVCFKDYKECYTIAELCGEVEE